MATNPARFVIIPLKEANSSLALEGEIISLNNGEFALMSANGVINPFDKFRDVFNSLFLNLPYYLWDEGGAKYGDIVGTGEEYTAHILNSYPPLTASNYVGFSSLLNEDNGLVGDTWIENGDTSFQIKQTGIAPITSQISWVYFMESMIPAYNETTFPIKVGTGTFKGPEVSTSGSNLIPIPTQTNTNYKVFITPNEDTKGTLGEVFITKTVSNFTVRNTGSNSGFGFNYLLVGGNLASLYDKYHFPVLSGSSYFNGASYRQINFASALENNSYVVLVQSVDDTSGILGQITITNKTSTGFRVFATGKQATSRFDWVVLKASML